MVWEKGILVTIEEEEIRGGRGVGFDFHTLAHSNEVTRIRHVLSGAPIVVVIEENKHQPVSCWYVFNFVRQGFPGVGEVGFVDLVDQERLLAVTRREVFAREEQEVDGSLVITAFDVTGASSGTRCTFFAARERARQCTFAVFVAGLREGVTGGSACTIGVFETSHTRCCSR